MLALTPRRLLAAIVALLAIGLGVERLVITDREAIESLLERATESVTADDWYGLSTTLDDAFAASGLDRGGFVEHVADLKKRHKPQGVGIEIGDTKIDGDHATTHVVIKPGAPYIGLRIEGRVEIVRTGEGWRISTVTEAETRYLGR